MLNDNEILDDPAKSLQKRQKKSLEFSAAAASSARDSLVLLEPTNDSSLNSNGSLNVHSSVKNDDLYLKLSSLLVESGFDENYLVDLRTSLIELQDESNRQRAARNEGDFDINGVKRILYTPEQKLKILSVYSTFHNHAVPASNVFNFIRTISGYEKGLTKLCLKTICINFPL